MITISTQYLLIYLDGGYKFTRIVIRLSDIFHHAHYTKKASEDSKYMIK